MKLKKSDLAWWRAKDKQLRGLVEILDAFKGAPSCRVQILNCSVYHSECTYARKDELEKIK